VGLLVRDSEFWGCMSICVRTYVLDIVSVNVIGTVVDRLVKYNRADGIFSTWLIGREYAE
jgi:hypothetical protein